MKKYRRFYYHALDALGLWCWCFAGTLAIALVIMAFWFDKAK
jgi:hypothetical protein